MVLILKMKPYTLSRGDDPKRYSQSYLDLKEEITEKNTFGCYILEQLFKIIR